MVTRSPDNPVAQYNLGRAHAARGEYELARQMFSKAIELRPDYVMARLALAQLEVMRGEYDVALKAAQAALQIDRGNVSARLIAAASLMGMQKFGESQAAARQHAEGESELARRPLPVGPGEPGAKQVQGSGRRISARPTS